MSSPPLERRPIHPVRRSTPGLVLSALSVLSVLLSFCAGCSTDGPDGTAAGAPTTVTVDRTVTVTVDRTVTVTAAPPVVADSAASAVPSSDGAGPSDGIPEHADACEVLERTEAQAVVARRLMAAAPAGVEFGKATYCTYAGYPDDPGVGQVEVFIGDGAEKALQIDRDTLKHDFRRIDGLGDECWAEDGQVFFRAGSTWVTIRVVLLEEDPEKAGRLEAAARIVLGRLP